MVNKNYNDEEELLKILTKLIKNSFKGNFVEPLFDSKNVLAESNVKELSKQIFNKLN